MSTKTKVGVVLQLLIAIGALVTSIMASRKSDRALELAMILRSIDLEEANRIRTARPLRCKDL